MSRKLISIIVPSYNEEGNVERLAQEVNKYIGDYDYEIVFVNDGSSDSTLEILKKMANRESRVKYLSFSRNFGHQAALRAGLAHARGNAVISMDADLQHPPKMIPQLLSKWREGYEVVYTIREDTADNSAFKRMTSKWFYKIINYLSGLSIKEGAADFRLMDRRVVDTVNQQNEPELFLRGYIDWIGYKQIGIPYVPAERFSGKSKYTLKKMFQLASNGITQFSIKPLRLAFSAAGLAMIAVLVYLVYAIMTAMMGYAIAGWLSLIMLFIFMQGIQFLLLGLIGEYLGRTFMQTKNRPDYIVSETNCER